MADKKLWEQIELPHNAGIVRGKEARKARAAGDSARAECRANWAKAAQLPPMPSELLLIAKDPLIGQALAKWAQSVCEQTVALRNELSAARAECETWKQRAESAEADAERYRWLRENDFNADDYLIAAVEAACEKRKDAVLTNDEKDAAIDAARGKS